MWEDHKERLLLKYPHLANQGLQLTMTAGELFRNLERAYNAGKRDFAETMKAVEKLQNPSNVADSFGDVLRGIFGENFPK